MFRFNLKKSFFITLIVVLLLGSFGVSAHAPEERIPFYFFYSETCPHCHKELVFLESIEEDNDRKYWASKIVRFSFYIDRLSVIKRIDDMGLLYPEELNLPWIGEDSLFKMDIIQYLASRGAEFKIADKEIEQALIDEFGAGEE